MSKRSSTARFCPRVRLRTCVCLSHPSLCLHLQQACLHEPMWAYARAFAGVASLETARNAQANARICPGPTVTGESFPPISLSRSLALSARARAPLILAEALTGAAGIICKIEALMSCHVLQHLHHLLQHIARSLQGTFPLQSERERYRKKYAKTQRLIATQH
jgi:hypothetical protein